MITQLFVLVFLALLYGLGWHDRPARESIPLDNPGTKRDDGRGLSRSAYKINNSGSSRGITLNLSASCSGRNRERLKKTKISIIPKTLTTFTVIGLVSLLAGCATPKSRPSGESSRDSYPCDYLDVPIDLRPF